MDPLANLFHVFTSYIICDHFCGRFQCQIRDGEFVFLTKFLNQTRQVQTKICLIIQLAVLVFQKRKEKKKQDIRDLPNLPVFLCSFSPFTSPFPIFGYKHI